MKRFDNSRNKDTSPVILEEDMWIKGTQFSLLGVIVHIG